MMKQQTDWNEINRIACERSLVPVALPQRDHIPFWNRKALQFISPPAFEVSRGPGAENYRFELKDDQGELLAAFTTRDPQEPLTPVWEKIPTGFVNLSILPVNKTGKAGDAIFTRRFYRCACFKGPYPLHNHDYRGGAERCLYLTYIIIKHKLQEFFLICSCNSDFRCYILPHEAQIATMKPKQKR